MFVIAALFVGFGTYAAIAPRPLTLQQGGSGSPFGSASSQELSVGQVRSVGVLVATLGLGLGTFIVLPPQGGEPPNQLTRVNARKARVTQ